MSIDEIIEEMKSLPKDSQLVLAEMLMNNLDSHMDEEVHQSHVDSVKRKMADTGTSSWTSEEDLFQTGRNLLKK